MTEAEMSVLVDEAIRGAVTSICEQMLGCEAEARETIRIGSPLQESDGVVALVGMAGPWIGTGALTCRPDLACTMAGKFLMTEYPEVNDEVLDAVAEIANMVFGNLKTCIEERVGEMGLSTPTTIYGASFTTKIGGSQSWSLIPFHLCGGEMLIQICVLPNRDHANTPHRTELAGHMFARR